MSFIQTVKQYFRKPSRPIESTSSKSQTIKNNEAAHLAEQLAAENQRNEADIKRYKEYLASERLKEKQIEFARLEKIKAEDQLKERRILEQQLAEQERFRTQQAEAARLEEIRAQERINQQQIIEQQIAEQERLKEVKENGRRAIEIERLIQIHALNQNETYFEYLREAERFRKEFGKNIQCDICGEWEVDLYNHRGQTYCEKHIPLGRRTETEYKVTAGRHGSSRSYIKR